MAVNVYECMLILDSNRYSRNQEQVSGEFSEMVKKHGGEVLVSRLWEERRLAYPIGNHRKGTYWLTYFKLDSSQVHTLERDCRLSDNIIRSLILKIEPRIADALVSHALEKNNKDAPASDSAEAESKAKAETEKSDDADSSNKGEEVAAAADGGDEKVAE